MPGVSVELVSYVSKVPMESADGGGGGHIMGLSCQLLARFPSSINIMMMKTTGN